MLLEQSSIASNIAVNEWEKTLYLIQNLKCQSIGTNNAKGDIKLNRNDDLGILNFNIPDRIKVICKDLQRIIRKKKEHIQ